jgi:hypothetical protein
MISLLPLRTASVSASWVYCWVLNGETDETLRPILEGDDLTAHSWTTPLDEWRIFREQIRSAHAERSCGASRDPFLCSCFHIKGRTPRGNWRGFSLFWEKASGPLTETRWHNDDLHWNSARDYQLGPLPAKWCWTLEARRMWREERPISPSCLMHHLSWIC